MTMQPDSGFFIRDPRGFPSFRFLLDSGGLSLPNQISLDLAVFYGYAQWATDDICCHERYCIRPDEPFLDNDSSLAILTITLLVHQDKILSGRWDV